MISIKTFGSFDKITKFLHKIENHSIFDVLDKYGQAGVDLLSSATPVDTGETAGDWNYEVLHEAGRYTIWFSNTHDEGNVNVAIILQYGHGTGTGGWVEGRDYINPAIRPLFDKIVDDIWRQVKNG